MKSRTASRGSDDKLKIIIRVRPVLREQESSMFVRMEGEDGLEILRPGNTSHMRFSNILPPQSNQRDVFVLLEDSIRQFLSGTNTTIFAYGQTGAGKTYSIVGNYIPNDSQDNLFHFMSSQQRGVLSRSLQMIMSETNRSPNVKLYLSFYQIYNEKIFDLYNYTNTALQIRESKNGEISIPQLVNVEVHNMQQAIFFIITGLRNRTTGSTHAHSVSSRSHSVFQITRQEQLSDEVVSSTLRIVDLAGSQKFKISSDLTSAEKDIRIQQLTSINSSLSCLGHCISALIDKSRTHIPFRNSKLTRILSDSLLGHGKMRFIICISPSISASAQTFSTLQFANRAKRAVFDRSQPKSPTMNKKKSQSQQILLLRKELQKERQLRMFAEKEAKDLRKQNQILKEQNKKLKHCRKGVESASRMSHYDQSNASQYKNGSNKENQLKGQMMKLAIFQNKQASPPTSNSRSLSQINYNNHSKVNPVNKKKAQFQKKIKKFMEADSPLEQTSQQVPNQIKKDIQNIPSYAIKKSQNKAAVYDNRTGQQGQSYWGDSREDSNMFIEKACSRMNVHQFEQLKNQMAKARQELLNLQRKDHELEKRKNCIK